MTIFAIGRCEGYSANKARIAELEQKIAQLESSDTEGSSTTETSASNQSEEVSQSESSTNSANESMPVGTYQIADKTNNTWILTIKADETATIGKKVVTKLPMARSNYTLHQAAIFMNSTTMKHLFCGSRQAKKELLR